MSVYKKFLKIVSTIAMWVSMAALFLLVVLNTYEIGNRYFLSRSNYWIQDVSLLLMMWFLFTGVVKVIHDSRDIYADILVAALPPKLQKACSFIVNSLSLVFNAALCYNGYKLLLVRQGRTTVTAGIPTSWYVSAIIVCCAILSLIFFRNLYDLFFLKEEALSERYMDGGVEQ